MTNYESKHGVVSKAPYELYMSFCDMRNFVQMLPPDKREGVTADYDTITATVQGFNIGVKVHNRTPYSKLEFVDYGAPFAFKVDLHYDSTGACDKTDFWIEASAELNFMMKMMIGSKIKDALDKIVDSLVDISNGKMPEGFDPSQFNGTQFNG